MLSNCFKTKVSQLAWLNVSLVIAARPLLIVGSGGHAQMLAGWLLEAGMPETLFYWLELEAKATQQPELWGRPVLSQERFLKGAYPNLKQPFALLGLGSIKSSPPRWKAFESLKPFVEWVSWAHPSAIVSSKAQIGLGSVVCPLACVQPFAVVGQACLINTSAILEHHAQIGANCHLAPGAIMCGNSSLGEHSFVGANAVVKQGLLLPAGTTIGAGVFVKQAPQI
jgi:sugar O-acyltransferase (sialic acid O-acetyltransferase NeuD family)